MQDVDVHGTTSGACAAAEALENLRVESSHRRSRGFEGLDVIDRLVPREEGDLGDIHVRLDDGLAGQPDFDPVGVGEAVDRAAGAADSAPTAAAPDQLIARVFEGFLNGQGVGDVVPFAHDEDGDFALIFFLDTGHGLFGFAFGFTHRARPLSLRRFRSNATGPGPGSAR